MTGTMDIRSPNCFDLLPASAGGLDEKIRQIYTKYHTEVLIAEFETVMEAPDADAEILTAFTNTFSGAARNFDTVTCVPDVASSLNNCYFWFYIATTQHYCWFNVAAGGTDPSVAGTGHEVAFAADATANTIATAIQAVVDAIADVTSVDLTGGISIENDNVGVVTAAAYDGAGAGATGFTFVNDIAGTAAYTANYFYAVSDSVKDDSAGVGTRTIRVFIVDENNNPGYTDMIMDGTTQVKSSVKAIAIYGVIGLTAGSEHDTAGTLVIQDLGQTDVYATIAAGGMGTVTQRCWIPDGWNCVLGDFHGHVVEANHATIDIILDLAAIYTPIWGGLASGVTPDVIDQYVVAHLTEHIENSDNTITPGADGCYRTMNHVTKADDNNTTGVIHTRYILWSDD